MSTPARNAFFFRISGHFSPQALADQAVARAIAKSSYELRPSARQYCKLVSSTWLDQDTSGTFLARGEKPRIRSPPPPSPRPRREPCSGSQSRIPRTPSGQLARQTGKSHILVFSPSVISAKATLAAMGTEGENWPYEKTTNILCQEQPEEFDWSGFEQNPHGLRKRASDPISTTSGVTSSSDIDAATNTSLTSVETTRDGRPYPTLGHLAARGCKNCFEINIECDHIQNDTIFPCSHCAEDDEPCELIISPKIKATCQSCKRSRVACSYNSTDVEAEHAEPCMQCQNDAKLCSAGPRVGRRRQSRSPKTAPKTVESGDSEGEANSGGAHPVVREKVDESNIENELVETVDAEDVPEAVERIDGKDDPEKVNEDQGDDEMEGIQSGEQIKHPVSLSKDHEKPNASPSDTVQIISDLSASKAQLESGDISELAFLNNHPSIHIPEDAHLALSNDGKSSACLNISDEAGDVLGQMSGDPDGDLLKQKLDSLFGDTEEPNEGLDMAFDTHSGKPDPAKTNAVGVDAASAIHSQPSGDNDGIDNLFVEKGGYGNMQDQEPLDHLNPIPISEDDGIRVHDTLTNISESVGVGAMPMAPMFPQLQAQPLKDPHPLNVTQSFDAPDIPASSDAETNQEAQDLRDRIITKNVKYYGNPSKKGRDALQSVASKAITTQIMNNRKQKKTSNYEKPSVKEAIDSDDDPFQRIISKDDPERSPPGNAGNDIEMTHRKESQEYSKEEQRKRKRGGDDVAGPSNKKKGGDSAAAGAATARASKVNKVDIKKQKKKPATNKSMGAKDAGVMNGVPLPTSTPKANNKRVLEENYNDDEDEDDYGFSRVTTTKRSGDDDDTKGEPMSSIWGLASKAAEKSPSDPRPATKRRNENVRRATPPQKQDANTTASRGGKVYKSSSIIATEDEDEDNSPVINPNISTPLTQNSNPSAPSPPPPPRRNRSRPTTQTPSHSPPTPTNPSTVDLNTTLLSSSSTSYSDLARKKRNLRLARQHLRRQERELSHAVEMLRGGRGYNAAAVGGGCCGCSRGRGMRGGGGFENGEVVDLTLDDGEANDDRKKKKERGWKEVIVLDDDDDDEGTD